LRRRSKTIFIKGYRLFLMKKIFTIFCAVCLLPSFSAHAWIGGPFSNNSYFSQAGDDGVYEAVAFPVRNLMNPDQEIRNGIGMYRWAVTNNTSFSDSVSTSTSQVFFDDEGNIAFTLVDIIPLTSNVYFGGVGQTSHTWFIRGVVYRGTCEGSVNSGIGVVNCVGSSSSNNGNGLIESSFKGKYSSAGDGGKGIPISRFRAKGRGTLISVGNPAATVNFRFRVLGSKVTQGVTYNGLSG
jgi:hypothetical protein